MASVEQFGREIPVVMAQLRQHVEVKIVRFAMETRRKLARRTPVRTGRHAASWNLRSATPDRSVRPMSYFGPGPERIAAGRITVGRYRLGQDLFISNHGEAIRRLEDGHSRQAPAGFIFPTLIEMEERAQEILR